MPNSKYWIEWNGISSDTMGDIIVTKAGIHSRPKRKVDVYNVPGRNGDIVIPQNSWENFNITYEIFVGNGAENNTPAKFHEIAEWLYKPTGYVKLRDGSDPDYFLMAYFVGPYDVENTLTQYGRCEISFICRPERFLNSGDVQTTYTSSPVVLNNPTSFASKPYFYLTTAGNTPSMIQWADRVEYTETIEVGGKFPFDKPYIYLGIDWNGQDSSGASVIQAYTIQEGDATYNDFLRYRASKSGSSPVATSVAIGLNVDCDPNTMYSIKADMIVPSSVTVGSNTLTPYIAVAFYTSSGKLVGHTNYLIAGGDATPRCLTFTTPSKCYHLIVILAAEAPDTAVRFQNIQLQPTIVDDQGRKIGDGTNDYTNWNYVKNGTLTVNDTVFTFSSLDRYLRVDCDTMNVYRSNTQNRNNITTISTGDFPVFTSGENNISWSGDINRVDVKPRWWTI